MSDMISIHQQSGTIQAYVAVPQKSGHYKGAVLVAHELWGLTEQIKRTADRLAEQGYMALAPDLFSTDKINRQPSAELQAAIFSADEHVRYNAMPELRAMIAPTQTPQFKLLALSRLESCFEYLYNQPLAHQKVSIVGFGLGGGYAFELAMREQRLQTAIVFYGRSPNVQAELRHIRCPILAFYGSKETALAKESTAVDQHMNQAGVTFRSVMYEGAGHAFFNEDNGFAYNSIAAKDSWRRALDFLAGKM